MAGQSTVHSDEIVDKLEELKPVVEEIAQLYKEFGVSIPGILSKQNATTFALVVVGSAIGGLIGALLG